MLFFLINVTQFFVNIYRNSCYHSKPVPAAIVHYPWSLGSVEKTNLKLLCYFFNLTLNYRIFLI